MEVKPKQAMKNIDHKMSEALVQGNDSIPFTAALQIEIKVQIPNDMAPINECNCVGMYLLENNFR
jgi:hypothetical protein